MIPTDRRDIARNVRHEVEGLWSWTPAMEGIADDIKKVEERGAPSPASVPNVGYRAIEVFGGEATPLKIVGVSVLLAGIAGLVIMGTYFKFKQQAETIRSVAEVLK